MSPPTYFQNLKICCNKNKLGYITFALSCFHFMYLSSRRNHVVCKSDLICPLRVATFGNGCLVVWLDESSKPSTTQIPRHVNFICLLTIQIVHITNIPYVRRVHDLMLTYLVRFQSAFTILAFMTFTYYHDEVYSILT